MPFSFGNSANWLGVCAHMMGKPSCPRTTVELPSDAAQAKRRPRSTVRSMAEDLEPQRERNGIKSSDSRLRLELLLQGLYSRYAGDNGSVYPPGEIR